MNKLLTALESDDLESFLIEKKELENAQDTLLILASNFNAKTCISYLIKQQSDIHSTQIRALKYIIEDNENTSSSIPESIIKSFSCQLVYLMSKDKSNLEKDYNIEPITQAILSSPQAASWINKLFYSIEEYGLFISKIKRATQFKERKNPHYPDNLVELLLDNRLPSTILSNITDSLYLELLNNLFNSNSAKNVIMACKLLTYRNLPSDPVFNGNIVALFHYQSRLNSLPRLITDEHKKGNGTTHKETYRAIADFIICFKLFFDRLSSESTQKVFFHTKTYAENEYSIDDTAHYMALLCTVPVLDYMTHEERDIIFSLFLEYDDKSTALKRLFIQASSTKEDLLIYKDCYHWIEAQITKMDIPSYIASHKGHFCVETSYPSCHLDANYRLALYTKMIPKLQYLTIPNNFNLNVFFESHLIKLENLKILTMSSEEQLINAVDDYKKSARLIRYLGSTPFSLLPKSEGNKEFKSALLQMISEQ